VVWNLSGMALQVGPIDMFDTNLKPPAIAEKRINIFERAKKFAEQTGGEPHRGAWILPRRVSRRKGKHVFQEAYKEGGWPSSVQGERQYLTRASSRFNSQS